MKRRLTTILAADLAGYSRLMASDEEGVITRLRAARKEVVDPAIAEGGGRLVKTMGDGLLVEFASPVSAVRTALSVQRAMAAREGDLAEEDRLRFRVGVHLGDVVIDGDDLLGDGVNVAARLESLSPVGGLCVSRTVHDQVRGRVDATMTDLGPQPVKNLPEPVEVWRVEIEGAGAAAGPAAAPKGRDRPSIAVLPFQNFSADPDQDFLADGLVEDVITELSRFRWLMVIARNSTFAYKDSARDVREIAKELGARYVVEGSVRRSGERLRVTVQLIDAETGAHVCAERWDRRLTDLFDLQDELTSALITAIEPELGAHERSLARGRPTESLSAWELCQRGVSELASQTDAGLAAAEGFLRASAAADPRFALPRAVLARLAVARILTDRSADPAQDVAAALEDAAQALELDDRLDVAHAAQGVLLAYAGREADSRAALDRALGLNPNNALVQHTRCMASIFAAEPDPEALAGSASEALRLSPKDPLAPAWHFWLGWAEVLRFEATADAEALRHFEVACQYPNADWYVPMLAALLHARAGDREAARRRLEAALEKRPSLTAASYRVAFSFPAWPRALADMEPELEMLVELGLPAE